MFILTDLQASRDVSHLELRQKISQSLGQPLKKLELWRFDPALSSLRGKLGAVPRARRLKFPPGLSVTGLTFTQDVGTSQLAYGFLTKGIHLFIVESLCLLGERSVLGILFCHSADRSS